jgi:cell division protein FtsN
MAKRASQAFRGSERHPLPFWIWLLAGIGIGLGMAAVAFHQGWVPELRGERGPRPDARAQPEPAGDAGVRPAAEAEQRRRFDFYTLLPEMETVIPNEEIRREAEKPPAAPTATEQSQPVASGQRLFLQAGSFRSAPEAEQMKARLALFGVRAQVVPVTINGADWFRVRAGPFEDARALDSARATLEANGISAMAVRIEGG